jgi:hypothetical protein
VQCFWFWYPGSTGLILEHAGKCSLFIDIWINSLTVEQSSPVKLSGLGFFGGERSF